MIDLTKEFNDLIANDHDIILIRHNTTTHCHCWRKETATPDPNCPNCLGGGFVFQEFIKNGKLFKGEGILEFCCPVDNETYYIRSGDLLFEIWVNPQGDFKKEPKLGDSILKKSRWKVVFVDAPQSESHKPNFLKINAVVEPNLR
jgi:hypothetical protein